MAFGSVGNFIGEDDTLSQSGGNISEETPHQGKRIISRHFYNKKS